MNFEEESCPLEWWKGLNRHERKQHLLRFCDHHWNLDITATMELFCDDDQETRDLFWSNVLNEDQRYMIFYFFKPHEQRIKEAMKAKPKTKTKKKVAKVMKEFSKGKLKSGSGKKVTNPKQAVAIGYSEARRSKKS